MRRPSAAIPWIAVALLVSLLVRPDGEAEGQSLLGTGGLGVPMEAVTAAGRGVGSVGAGLFGWHLSPHDPAAASGLVIPSVVATLQPTRLDLAEGEGADAVGGTRFPLIGLSFPSDRGILTLSFSGILDQDWQARNESVLELAGQPVDVADEFRSEGGISAIRVGWSRGVGDQLSIGIGGGSYLGSIERRFARTFDPDQVGEDVEPFEARGQWDARGATALAGLLWQPASTFRVAGSASWSGGLRLRPTDATVEAGSELSRRYSLPTEFRVGASGLLTPLLAMNVGLSYADWTAVGEELSEGGTRGSALSYGGGLEWRGIQLLGRSLPLRIGHRRTELPFLFDGEEAEERATSGGIGFALSDAEEIPLARFDLALERGGRDAGPFSERFWRTTVTVRLAGS